MWYLVVWIYFLSLSLWNGLKSTPVYPQGNNWLGVDAMGIAALMRPPDINHRQISGCCNCSRCGALPFTPSSVIVLWPLITLALFQRKDSPAPPVFLARRKYRFLRLKQSSAKPVLGAWPVFLIPLLDMNRLYKTKFFISWMRSLLPEDLASKSLFGTQFVFSFFWIFTFCYSYRLVPHRKQILSSSA